MSENRPRPMRLCFLGCGWAASLHGRTLQAFRPHIECSFASRALEKARQCQSKYAGASAFGSYEAALDSPEVDVVAVLTPPATHLGWTLAALGAGKDVILEKPPVLRSSDFDEIEESCRRTGRLVFVAENYFYKPILARVRGAIRAGLVGDPLFIHLNAVKRQPTANWRDDPAIAGGGALYEGGVHWVNFAGSLGFAIRSVKAAAPSSAAPLERSIALLLEYEGGPVGVLSYSWEVASPLKGLRISRVYGHEGSLAFESNGLFLATSGKRWRLHVPGISDIQGYRGMFADFLAAWRQRGEPGMTLARARRDLEIIEEAYRSAGLAAVSPAR